MNKKIIITAAVTVAAILGAGVWWLEAAPTVGTAAASPAYIVINTPTPVTITASITDSSLLANGVNLLKTDAAGKTLSTVGVMRDDGLNGDVKAGDKIFSYRLTVNQPSVGQVYYRVSAAFKGVLQRSLSNVVAITVDPFKLPPDPGEAGKQTLTGIDSDGDGVRDDYQRYVAAKYVSSAKSQAAASQYGKAVQAALLPESSTSPSAALSGMLAGSRCLAATIGIKESYEALFELDQQLLNTGQRQAVFKDLQLKMRGVPIDSPDFDKLTPFCNLNPDNFPN